MIKTGNALLRVKRITGRNGPFCVADLSTDFGKFKVKDALLDQFEEGEYQVTAWISEIYLGQYVAYGKAVSEIRAQLHDLQVLAEDQRPVPAETVEPDPLDEGGDAPAAPPPAPAGAPDAGGATKPVDTRWDKFKKAVTASVKPKEDRPAPAGDLDDGIYDDEVLDAIERREPVKLDASINRAVLREQTAGLKQRGYRFNSKEQTWYPG